MGMRLIPDETERKAQIAMVTLKDIAKEAGVSINTVSCALRNSSRISEESKRKIKKIADRMGYTPNAAARSLRLKTTKVIGVIVTDVSNPVFGKMVKGIEAAIKEKEYSILIGNTDENEEMEKKAIGNMISKGVDGVIITPTQHDTKSLEMLQKANVPFILMGRKFKNFSANYVVCDDFRGGFLAGEYLIGKGHSKIIFINGPKHISSSQDREQGFVKALAGHRLVPRHIYYIMPEIHEGYRLMKKLLDARHDFTGVFCFDDYTAFGVMKALKDSGLRVPDDIAVVGYDNTDFADILDRGLTSVDFNEYRIGELAAEHVIEIIENNAKQEHASEPAVRQVILEPSLVVRGSV